MESTLIPVHSPLRADTGSATHRPTPAATQPPLHTLTSGHLLGGANEVQIDHHGATYRLRLTTLGKLILTK